MTDQKSTNKYYVYKITNSVNNKIYFGKGGSGRSRWKNHLYTAKIGKSSPSYSALHKGINKHGEENFSYEIIKTFNDEDLAYEFEKECITQSNSRNIKIGYNISEGGRAGKHSEASIEKIRQSHLGFKFTEESKLKMSLSHKGQRPVWSKFIDQEIIDMRIDFSIRKQFKEQSENIIYDLSKKYNASTHCISAIVQGVHYSDVRFIDFCVIKYGYKVCSKCKLEKPQSDFHNQIKSQDGLSGHCKECNGSYRKAKRKASII